MSLSLRRPAAVVAAALVAAGAAGCGAGAGESADGVQLLVTQDFGARTLVQTDAPRTGGSDTVMRLLERNARVEKRFGGGFVQEVDGVAGGTRDGRAVDWFFYVNGRQAPEGATSTEVRDGDRVWWDHHEWEAASGTPAVVGQFPAPFTTGLEGRRLPVRVECIDQDEPACTAVRDALVERDVPAARGGLQTSFAQETLRVLVGPWRAVRADGAAERLEGGPQRSGVYARPSRDGRSIAVLDDRGRTTRTLRAGAGLVAATQIEDVPPVWIVTGTDAAGLRAAAAALDEGTLGGRFALAVAGGREIPLPEPRVQR